MRKIDLNNFQPATSETARGINRRIVLNLIRTYQPISRADIARQSGLQRSTVSIITEQLIEERWVTEGANNHIPRGRRPQLLHLNKERVGIIGVNIRPSLTTMALADIDANFLVQDSMPTEADPKLFLKNLISKIRNIIKLHPDITYEGIGISLPGRIDLQTERLVFAPNLNWSNIDIKTPLEEALQMPVELENAANACALAEFWFGKHSQSIRNLIAVTVSEGLGCGIILNGQLVRGSSGGAGEFGHVPIVKDGFPCKCGNHGCWEVYASNSAAVRLYSQSETRSRKIESPSNKPVPTFDDIMSLAAQRSPKAIETLISTAQYLGYGISMLINGLAPDAIVIIGEITREWDLIGPIIHQSATQNSVMKFAPRILAADPADKPRLRGTIALVLQKHFGAPSLA